MYLWAGAGIGITETQQVKLLESLPSLRATYGKGLCCVLGFPMPLCRHKCNTMSGFCLDSKQNYQSLSLAAERTLHV